MGARPRIGLLLRIGLLVARWRVTGLRIAGRLIRPPTPRPHGEGQPAEHSDDDDYGVAGRPTSAELVYPVHEPACTEEGSDVHEDPGEERLRFHARGA